MDWTDLQAAEEARKGNQLAFRALVERHSRSVFRLDFRMTTGNTLEETELNVREAISGHILTLREFGEPVPEPTSIARQIDIGPL